MLSSEFIVTATGAVIALVFGYFPVLREKFAALTSEAKSGIMIGLMVLTGFAVWGAGCAGWIDSGIACTTADIPNLLKLIIMAIIGNQATNRIAPELPDVKQAKVERNARAILWSTEDGR
ncbi:MAG: hypothetical protein WC710_14080 [Gallionella sp.]|jgi:hypothetical protein